MRLIPLPAAGGERVPEGRVRGRQRSRDRSQRIVDPKQHIIVPHAQHAIPMLLQTMRAGIVVGPLIEMLAAVQFYHQSCLQADEICIEANDAVLAAEFVAE